MAALLSPLLSSSSSASSSPSNTQSVVPINSSSWSSAVSPFFFASPAISSSNRSSSAHFASGSLGFSISAGGGRGVFTSAFSSPAPASAAARRNPMTTNASSATAPSAANSVHDFTVKDINGEEVDLSKFKGKVLLIVNVASACGLTNGNYTELAEVYAGLKESGLEILAFPCNQFGGQESGSNEQIKEFACTRFKAEYPIFDKVDVNGPNTAPIYQFLKASKGGGILGDSIKWNFGKFLVNKDGVVVERYAPTTSPKNIEGDIKKLLDE